MSTFGTITVKGNESGSRKPSRWLVHEAVNARAAWNCIMMASVTGSVGGTDTEMLLPDRTERTLARVSRLCNVCGKPAGVYGAGHEACKKN